MVPESICQFFVKEGIPSTRIVTAVSGGTDSTALLLAFSDLQYDVVAAHINHHLRGEESDGDEEFVRSLCAQLGVPFRVADGTLDEARVRERGIEAAARAIRYEQLTKIRNEENAAYVATAHQKDDQAETVLMRLLGGSGIAGLRGIHPVRDDGFIRPMLDLTRAQIEAYLREKNVVPRVDRSNLDPRFLRNRVRAILSEVDATEALARVARQARAQWPVLENAIVEAEGECAQIAPAEVTFHRWPDDPWLRGALLQRQIRRLDPSARDFDAERIASQLDDVKRMSVTKSLELLRRGDAWILRRPSRPVEDFDLEFTDEAQIPALAMSIQLARATGSPRTPGVQRFQLPTGGQPTFTVRNRRPGDRFQPLGMTRAKKLKDFLIDRKIAAEVRDRLPLLVWKGEIVWVAGVEISELFKVTGHGDLYEVWTTHERDQPDLLR